jgi:glutathione S-transferase
MYRLHCFAQSGNAFKVAFCLRAMGQPFEPVLSSSIAGTTREPAWREAHNEMGEVPVLEDGDLTLTQSGVILTYLADKHGQFGGRDEAERREVLRWLLFDNHKFTAYFATYRFQRSFMPKAPDPVVLAFLLSRFEPAFEVADRHFAKQPFVIGERPTIADFSMFGYLAYPEEESGYPLRQRCPHLAAWVDRMKALPGWASPYDVMPGERLAPRWVS